MPIFISYNRKDRSFVDALASNLVAAKHHVWMDRWELSLGDSLIQKIEAALTKSSAILVILSKNSVESEWCKKELSAGLIRELDERKTIVMPCVIDDCEVPLFLRDKLYADFRQDPDEAFSLVDRSLAKISNALQGRSETPEFHTDHAFEWITIDGRYVLRWTFIDHGHNWPYVILSQCFVHCDKVSSREFGAAQKDDPAKTEFLKYVLSLIVAGFDESPLIEKITDSMEHFVAWKVKGVRKHDFTVRFMYRRIGEDNGMDTLVHLDNNLRRALERIEDITFRAAPDGGTDDVTKGLFLTGY